MKRQLACLTLLVTAILPARAQDPAEEPIRLTLRPAAAPTPALKYQLLPELRDQTPGNAALLYYRAFAPDWLSNLRQPRVVERVADSLRTPLRDMPRRELGSLLTANALREVDRAARREYCDWELTARMRQEGIYLLLPDVQGLREFGTLLAGRARLEMAEGHHDRAVYTLQTGFALGRHTSTGPTLIHALVGNAIATVMLQQAEDLIQTPGAPNLYWALTTLPRPFIDLRKPLEGEKLWLEALLELRDVETAPLSPERQEKLQVLTERLLGEVLGDRPVTWETRLDFMVLVLKAYPGARQALIAEGRKPEEVEALPALQVVLIHSLHQYNRERDDLYKWSYLPYREARAGVERAERQVARNARRREGLPFGRAFLPALGKVFEATGRLDRHIAALRCVEALRLHAAAHGGKLPATLGDITAVPVPIDPVTGQSFEYRVSADRATLHAPAPPGEKPTPYNTVNYELTLQR
jgi:hypothetical protein